MLKYKSIENKCIFPEPFISYKSIKVEVDIPNQAAKANVK